MHLVAAGEHRGHARLRVDVVEPAAARARQLPRLGPAALGELVAGPVPEPDGERPTGADVLDQRVPRGGAEGARGPG